MQQRFRERLVEFPTIGLLAMLTEPLRIFANCHISQANWA
jgi:hypothetical protein